MVLCFFIWEISFGGLGLLYLFVFNGVVWVCLKKKKIIVKAKRIDNWVL